MRNYQTGIMLSTTILFAYRLYLIFLATSTAVSVCNTKLRPYEKPTTGEYTSGYGECVEGRRTYYDSNGKKTARTVDCSLTMPTPFVLLNCISDELDKDKVAVGVQFIILTLQFIFITSGMDGPLQTLNLVSGFFDGTSSFIASRYIIVMNIIFIFAGDLLTGIVSPYKNGTNGGKGRGANGRFLGAG
jgi:hypothetical protein